MRLVGAELVKVVTTYRTFLGIVLAELGIVLLGTIVTVRDAANDPFLPPGFEQDLVGIGTTSLFFVTLLGVLIATSEYRHGTITLTFLVAPVREKVLAAGMDEILRARLQNLAGCVEAARERGGGRALDLDGLLQTAA